MRDQNKRKELLLLNYDPEPSKIKLNFKGCYNFDKLKKEGLV
jgi:hypothetical protein